MKKKLLLLGSIAIMTVVCCFGCGKKENATVSSSQSENESTKEEEKNEKKEPEIIETELKLTDENLIQTGQFYSDGHSRIEASHVVFELKLDDNVKYEAIIADAGCFSIMLEGYKTVHELSWVYPDEQNPEVRWIPLDYRPIPEEEFDEYNENREKWLRMDHYIYLILREEEHITGLVVLKFPVDDQQRFMDIVVVGAHTYEKIDGEYQDVSREYVEKRAQEMIEQDKK